LANFIPILLGIVEIKSKAVCYSGWCFGQWVKIAVKTRIENDEITLVFAKI